MKNRTHSFYTTFLLLLTLFLNNPAFAKADDPSPDKFEHTSVLTLTTTITETYCGGCVGAIDLMVSGGETPYTYDWANGAMTEDIDNLCIGVYGVTVTDATGCTASTNPFVGQNNYPNVELESQAEVDAYVDNFSFCGEVPGVLRIGTTFSDPPSDITDISGLSFITSVGSNLFIFQNHNLSSLDGLQNITSIGNSISITNNDGLTNLSGFPAINAINSNFSIDNCAGLTSLEGLNQVSSIGGDVYLSNTTNLTSLSALSNLQTINGELDIRICLDLLSFDGLENLTTIGEDLIIRDNIMLNDILALNHPIAIGGNLEIQNTNLSNCSIIPICEMLDAGANATISNNSNGCNTSDQIISNCTSGPNAISLEGMLPICPGDCNGTITVSVTGGTSPFLYQWSNGAVVNSPLLPGLCADEYSVTVSDVDGLTISATFELMDPASVEFVMDEIGDDINGQNNGYFNTSISGGVGPFTYEWYLNGMLVSTSEDPTDLAAGDYTLEVNDNGCVSEYGPFTINSIVGLESIADQSVLIFPVPAEEYIRVAFEFPISENVRYTLWNSAGALMQSGIISNNDLIPIEKLDTGIYFLKIETNGGILVRKVVKGK